MKTTVRELVQATKGRLLVGFPEASCEHVSIDTRTLRPGDIFFALPGPRFDGHHFLKVASQKKAGALVVERVDATTQLESDCPLPIIQVTNSLTALQETARLARDKANKTTFIGLTGSNGKTTTKEMLALILKRAGKTLATRGNLNNHIGLPLTLTECSADHRFVLLEMGTSMPGDMDLLAGLAKSQIALITNVGKDHLEFFKTPEGVLKENRKLFDALPSGGTAVINLDDPLLKECRSGLKSKVVTYSLTGEADVTARDIVPHPVPLRFMLTLSGKKYPVSLQATGTLQVQNAIAAAAVAYALKITPEDIVAGLEQFKSASMRMEVRTLPGGGILMDDAYNANPSSMRASIESFCQTYPDLSKWLVLADMRELGPGAGEEHRDLGRWIGERSIAKVYVYGRDARFIQQGIAETRFKGQVERFHKKKKLLEALKVALATEPRSAILFKASRRMKLEQVSHALSTSLRAMVSEP